MTRAEARARARGIVAGLAHRLTVSGRAYAGRYARARLGLGPLPDPTFPHGAAIRRMVDARLEDLDRVDGMDAEDPVDVWANVVPIEAARLARDQRPDGAA